MIYVSEMNGHALKLGPLQPGALLPTTHKGSEPPLNPLVLDRMQKNLMNYLLIFSRCIIIKRLESVRWWESRTPPVPCPSLSCVCVWGAFFTPSNHWNFEGPGSTAPWVVADSVPRASFTLAGEINKWMVINEHCAIANLPHQNMCNKRINVIEICANITQLTFRPTATGTEACAHPFSDPVTELSYQHVWNELKFNISIILSHPHISGKPIPKHWTL